MSTVKMLWTMWCLCIRLSACTVKRSCRSWGELITPHQRIIWTLSTRTTNCWRRKTSLSWNRLASRSRSCLACGLQSRPHYSHCRTHVSPPAGRFETSREEVCQVWIHCRPLVASSRCSRCHTFPRAKKRRCWSANNEEQLVDSLLSCCALEEWHGWLPWMEIVLNETKLFLLPFCSGCYDILTRN